MSASGTPNRRRPREDDSIGRDQKRARTTNDDADASESFGENISPTRVIKGILDQYPFGIGIFRELLQNSDDAKATEQIFVLDRRTHNDASLLSQGLSNTQGPALLAYNNSIFHEEDWTALRSISNSSKTADSSKIGKYGLGFRSSYHVTDYPQILSGSSLVIFDPHRHIFPDGGVRNDFVKQNVGADQLLGFQSLLPDTRKRALDGTIIRLPLRTAADAARSELADRPTDPAALSQLLHEFADTELQVVLLFLKHVRSIEVKEVDDAGTRVLARATLDRKSDVVKRGGPLGVSTQTCAIATSKSGAKEQSTRWLIATSDCDDGVVAELVNTLGPRTADRLQAKKLVPQVAFAFPLPASSKRALADAAFTGGRLFTFLPLPAYTGFPCHINGLFALTTDRQHLINAQETGLAGDSDHRLYIEWNKTLFHSVVPRAWASCLLVLAEAASAADFGFWPPWTAPTGSSESVYWGEIAKAVLRETNRADLAVWPVAHAPAKSAKHLPLSGVLLAARSGDSAIVRTLSTARVKVSQVPDHIFEALRSSNRSDRILAPGSARRELLKSKDAVQKLKLADRQNLLRFLTADGNLGPVEDLPLFRTPQGQSVSLSKTKDVVYTLLQASEADLFAPYLQFPLATRDMPPQVARLLASQGPDLFNIRPLVADEVKSCLNATQGSVDDDWLVSFWGWIHGSALGEGLIASGGLDDIVCVPCSPEDTSRRLSDGIFLSAGLDDDDLSALRGIGIHFLSPDVPAEAAELLKKSGKLDSPKDARQIIRRAQVDADSSIDEHTAERLRRYLERYIPSSPRLHDQGRVQLRSLPIFSVVNYTSKAAVAIKLGSIPPKGPVFHVAEDVLVPRIDDIVFVADALDLGPFLVPSAAPRPKQLQQIDVLPLAVDNISSQPKAAQVAFLEHLVEMRKNVPPSVCETLARQVFVASRTKTLKSPSELVDPGSRIAKELLDKDDGRLPIVSGVPDRKIVAALAKLGLLASKLSQAIVVQCIRWIGDAGAGPEKTRFRRACALISLIQTEHFDCTTLAGDDVDVAWMPDAENNLRYMSELYFEDIEDTDAAIPEDKFSANECLKGDLARELGIEFLSGLCLRLVEDEEIDEDDMGESLTTRISNVLRQYPVEQAILEMLANAADAGAKKFGILLQAGDENAPQGRLVSQKMAQFQTTPALVIHNDAVFAEKDWKGIRQVGRGGKEDTPDTIGRFGLGALSMYHFSEVAMIVSDRYVMLLDPSRKYLSADGKKTCTKIALAKLRSTYPDHLKLLEGIFGFSMRKNTYQGTLFRLPIRTQAQAAESLLCRETTEDLDKRLEHTYKNLAESSLFFTQLKSVSMHHKRGKLRVSPQWSVTCDREIMKSADDFECTQVRLHVSGGDGADYRWYVATRRFGRDVLPDEYKPLINKYRLPEQFTVAAAIHVTNNPSAMAEKRQLPDHKLYATLPLPVLTHLPMHLHASFILSDDRRNIRWDDTGMHNPESRFNRWLLEDCTAALLRFTLPLLPPEAKQAWWPKRRDEFVSKAVTAAFYRHLAHEPEKMCIDVRGDWVSPREAIVLAGTKVPQIIRELLVSVLRPQNMVVLPTASLEFSSDLCPVDADFVRHAIQENSESLRKAYQQRKLTIQNIVEYVQYLGENRLVDLPLLPLANGKLDCYAAGRPPRYVKRPVPALFPADRFVHPDFEPADLEKIVAQDIGIALFTPEAVHSLITERIGEAQTATLNQEDADWAKRILDNLLLLPHSSTAALRSVQVAEIPLIPSLAGNRHLSLERCLAPDVLIEPAEQEDVLLIPLLTEIGALFVRHADLDFGKEARELREERRFSFATVLAVFKHKGRAARTSLANASEQNRQLFASWAIRKLQNSVPQADLIHVAKHLPIWPARTARGEERHLTISKVKMLPQRVPLSDIIRFLDPDAGFFAQFDTGMRRLGAQELTECDFRDTLRFPSRLNANATEDLKKLYRVLVPRVLLDSRPLKVPAGNGKLLDSSELYARSVPIFSAAFASQQARFIHESFLVFEDQLSGFGLRQTVNFDAFRACATAISQDDANGVVGRASTVFAWYNEEMPSKVGSAASHPEAWASLRSIRFIPFHTERRRGAPANWSTQYAVPIATTLCTPAEMLRPAHECIAWTQRARFLTDPDERLLLADLSLGVPTVQEVVKHLRVLVTRIARDHPRHPILKEDLQATYAWLLKHAEEASEFLDQNDEALWLNVDDISSDEWVWERPSRLIFNSPDDGDLRQVRKWLEGFKDLLIDVGAREVVRPEEPEVPQTSAEEQLAAFRTIGQELRDKRQLTDVVIVTADGAEFPAHRFLLSLSSDYFKSAFSSFGGEESKVASAAAPVKMPIRDFKATAVSAALDHAYTGKTPEGPTVNLDLLMELLRLSQYWSLRDLATNVQKQLIKRISLRNHEELLELANAHGADMLNEACRRFISLNKDQIY